VLYILHYLKRRRTTQCDSKKKNKFKILMQNIWAFLFHLHRKHLSHELVINLHILTPNWKSDVIILHPNMHSVQITNCNFTTSPIMSSTLGVASLRHHAIITEFHDSTQTPLCWLKKYGSNYTTPGLKKKKKVGFFF